MKNIFLTGKIGIGKSAVLNKVLDSLPLSVGGFITVPVIEENTLSGFKIRDIRTGSEAEVGYFDEDFMIHPVTEGFETVGVDSLDGALEYADIIVMDELGFLENNAEGFKEKVFCALKSEKYVLGVIKRERNLFLNTVASMSEVIDVRLANRDFLAEKIRRMINEESLR